MDGKGDLYGTTVWGGANNLGSVFEIPAGTQSLTTIASFSNSTGINPYAGVTLDASGNLYGTTHAGGIGGGGTIFEIPAGSQTLTTLASFNGGNGSAPYASLLLDGSGNLYGTTYTGGANNDGTIFDISATNHVLTTLASFNGANGTNPYGTLVMDTAGNLYGTTYGGGASNYGLVFELATGSNAPTNLASFASTYSHLAPGLAIDNSGNLYGATAAISPFNGDGNFTFFELAAGTRALSTLASGNGSQPQAGPIIDGSGNLYASALGAVLELIAHTQTLTTLISFNGTNGSGPEGGSLVDAGGSLYGATQSGGSGGYGTVFQYSLANQTLTTRFSFSTPLGANPVGDLSVDQNGNMYGTTTSGGANHDGTAFELTANTHSLTTLYSFNSAAGGYAYNGVIADANGNLYGTIPGVNNDGMVFEIPVATHTLTTLVSFNGANGNRPEGNLIMDSAGNLYGTTEFGGASNDGTVFEVAASTHILTTLASFNGTNGSDPYAGLAMDGSGNLFGTTSGNANSGGTVFEIPVSTGTLTTLISFASGGVNGSNPVGGVVLDSAGNLYGMTQSGGDYGYGTAFKMSATTHYLIWSISFNYTNGEPRGTVAIDGNGNVFGTTFGGGANGSGTAFEITAQPLALRTLFSFNGNFSWDGVVMDTSGNIYGTSTLGGATGGGTLFELAPTAFTGPATYLKRDADGQHVNVWNNTTGIGAVAQSLLLSAEPSMTFTGVSGSNMLVVDFSNGDPLPPSGLGFTGTGSQNTLNVIGSSVGDTIAVAAGQVTFNGTPITFTNVQTLQIDPGAGADSLAVSAAAVMLPAGPGTGTILTRHLANLALSGSARVVVAPAVSPASRTLIVADALSISSDSTLDLNSNDMAVTKGSLSGITAWIKRGLNLGGGIWTGAAISSSTAAGDSSHLTALGVLSGLSSFDGQSVSPSDVLVKYTYYGDADLSGKVDGTDYSLIDHGFNSPGATGWQNGDFNYDGKIDGSDYSLIDNAFNMQGTSLAASVQGGSVAKPAMQIFSGNIVDQAVGRGTIVSAKSPANSPQPLADSAASVFNAGQVPSSVWYSDMAANDDAWLNLLKRGLK